jgi:hypothetical protein
MIHAVERGATVGAVLAFAVNYPPLALAILAAVGDASAFPDVLGMVDEVVEGKEKQVRNQPLGFVVGAILGAGVAGPFGRLLAEMVPYAALI